MHGKTILITGGSKGTGLACAHAVATEGAQIAICSRTQANIDEALKTLPGAIGFIGRRGASIRMPILRALQCHTS
jgi:NAD(P)-dependent dehydrogenase (short-subunit alcohol dehydrogenase family)